MPHYAREMVVVEGLENELEGITVISVEQAVAAPYCGMLLADAGARVIKIERPGGDFARIYDRWAEGESAIFIWLNRGKESICLDMKSEAYNRTVPTKDRQEGVAAFNEKRTPNFTGN